MFHLILHYSGIYNPLYRTIQPSSLQRQSKLVLLPIGPRRLPLNPRPIGYIGVMENKMEITVMELHMVYNHLKSGEAHMMLDQACRSAIGCTTARCTDFQPRSQWSFGHVLTRAWNGRCVLPSAWLSAALIESNCRFRVELCSAKVSEFRLSGLLEDCYTYTILCPVLLPTYSSCSSPLHAEAGHHCVVAPCFFPLA